MKTIAILIIKVYQKTLSPDHGLLKFKYPYGFCRFYPSCSQYSIDSLKKYGFIKGITLSVIRILSCNPFSKPQIKKVV